MTSVLKIALTATFAATLAACAPTTPLGLDVSTQTPASTTQIAAPMAVVGTSTPVHTGRLSLIQICAPTGGKCTLAFVDTLPTDNVSQLVREYFTRVGTTPVPQVNVENNCSPGWVASVLSEQGTVIGGGLLHAQAAVCGHPTPMSAINKALDLCDAQTSGGCRKSTRIKVVWGEWISNRLAGREMEPGRPYEAWVYPGGMQCESGVPIVSSVRCSPEAAAAVRAAGVRFP